MLFKFILDHLYTDIVRISEIDDNQKKYSFGRLRKIHNIETIFLQKKEKYLYILNILKKLEIPTKYYKKFFVPYTILDYINGEGDIKYQQTFPQPFFYNLIRSGDGYTRTAIYDKTIF